MNGKLEASTDMCGYSTISQNSFKNESGYSTESSSDCGNTAILSGFHDDRFSDDFKDRNDNSNDIPLIIDLI